MIRKLEGFRRLTKAERRIFLRAWFLLLGFDLGLRLLPFSWVRKRASLRADPGANPPLSVERIAGLVSMAGDNHLYRMTCLRRSLALQRLLAQSGVAADLCLGVRKPEGAFQAHSWLEIDGAVVGDDPRAGDFHRLEEASESPETTRSRETG